jgi:MFS family permease
MNPLGVLRGNRDLVRLELTWAAVTMVRWSLAILVGLYAYSAAGAAAVGWAATVRLIAGAVATPLLASQADRRSRRGIVVLCLIVQVALAVATASLVAVSAALPWVLVTTSAYGVADAAQKPTQAALMLEYARTPAELATANALWGMLDNASFVIGSVVVAVAVDLSGLATAYWVCVVPLAAGVLLALSLARDEPRTPIGVTDGGLGEILDGVRAASAQPQLRLAILLRSATMFVEAAVDVLLVVASITLLGLGQQGPGWLSSAWGVGAVVGGWVVVTFVRRRLAIGVASGLLFAGLPLVVIGTWPGIPTAVVAMLVMGTGFGLLEAALLTVTQRLVPADLAGRVYGAEELLAMVAMMVGSLATSALVAGFGARGALVAVGAILPGIAALCAVSLRRLSSEEPADERTYALLRAVPSFAPLPVATLESLALRSRRTAVRAGVEVIRQGDVGDAFHVIESGEVEVLENGERRRTQRAGDHFGEIALLRNTPRTATVRTSTPVTLVSLGREEFLAAVSAAPRVKHELEHVVRARLLAPAEEAD